MRTDSLITVEDAQIHFHKMNRAQMSRYNAIARRRLGYNMSGYVGIIYCLVRDGWPVSVHDSMAKAEKAAIAEREAQ